MFDVMFVIVPIFIGLVFIFTFVMIIGPKLRGKMMSKQIEATKYMINESKDALEDIAKTASDVYINSSKNILDNHGDTLKEMATKRANINAEGIEITTRAIKDGLTKKIVYCKYCGKPIDEDSKFCKHCGKEL